jgi:3-deoxy-D-manno-octulosonic-acid transferase
MLWIYNIGIGLYQILLRFASIFNVKAKLFVEGRKNIFEQIKQKVDPNDRPIWFHFASLGEFEQGKPVLEKLKSISPTQKIVVTFFSPSGYEIKKNYALADVFYLPLDTASHAEKFLALVNPKQAIFTKYEFWFHYFRVLHQKEIPLYLISGIFRPKQAFFRRYGKFYRNMLKFVTHFFVQNTESVALLKSIGITNVTLSGDTRFDSVYKNAQEVKKLPLIEAFCGNSNVLIAGSTWPKDESLLVDWSAKHPDWKLVIAPHEIGATHLQEIENLFPNAVKFSDLDKFTQNQAQYPQLLIINNIGMLSSLYQYGKIAYIGGGFGAGIHNILEAAAFGLPVIFGPKYEKFQEAKDLIDLKCAKSISSAQELALAFDKFTTAENIAFDIKNYVNTKKGATEVIIKHLCN